MKQKTKDNLIYLGVAGAIVAALAFYIFYTEKTTGRIPDFPGHVFWGILSTPLIVALLFEQFWAFRRRRSLWVISLTAAAVNGVAIYVVYVFGWDPPAIVWSAITVLWLTLALLVAGKFVVRNRSG